MEEMRKEDLVPAAAETDEAPVTDRPEERAAETGAGEEKETQETARETPAAEAEPAEAPEETPAEEEDAPLPPPLPVNLREADLALFAALYPDTDSEKLEQSAPFRRFCGSRLGREPLARLYEDYRAVTAELEEAARTRAESRRSRSTGSGSSSGGETLTAREQAALDAWNRECPHLRMSAKEFLSFRSV